MTTNSNARKRYSFISLILCVSVIFTSCINNIPHEDKIPQPGNTPIQLNASPNRVSSFPPDNIFNSGDKIGLYVTIQPSALQNTRYIDNASHTYSAELGFVPNETIFFPEGDNICDFTAYYPYREKGIAEGSTELEVQVPQDQSSIARLSSYDFMVGMTKGVRESASSVDIDMDHKLFCYDIRLKIGSGYTLESLLNANPEVRIKDVYTKGTYNFTTGNFTNLSAKSDIIPHGIWTVKDNMLCGKNALIIPQTLSDSHAIIELYVDDRIYECRYMQEYTLESGVMEESMITLLASEDATRINVSFSAKGWNLTQSEMEATQRISSIQTDKLDFANSNVIKVMHKNEQVAEICKEYLLAGGVDTQATVIYPAKNGKADLTKGMVIELIGETGLKHGGSVNWDTTTNLPDYTAGSSPVPTRVYVAPDGSIKTTRPANALQLELKPDRLIDSRGDETIEYPITKIGTQYWIRSNYKPTKYNDGTDIEMGSVTATNTTPQHYIHLVYYFYNSKTIATGKLTPQGWRVPSESDYTRLADYINNNAAVLKNGVTWQYSDHDYTNLTGFNAAATGYFDPAYKHNASSVAYWTTKDNDPTITGKMITLQTSDNNVKITTVTGDKALAIRCIRE